MDVCPAGKEAGVCGGRKDGARSQESRLTSQSLPSPAAEGGATGLGLMGTKLGRRKGEEASSQPRGICDTTGPRPPWSSLNTGARPQLFLSHRPLAFFYGYNVTMLLPPNIY